PARHDHYFRRHVPIPAVSSAGSRDSNRNRGAVFGPKEYTPNGLPRALCRSGDGPFGFRPDEQRARELTITALQLWGNKIKSELLEIEIDNPKNQNLFFGP